MQEKESEEAEELGMDNMQGVFLVLEMGTLFAFIFGCVELVVTVYRTAEKAKVYLIRDLYLFFHRINSMYIFLITAAIPYDPHNLCFYILMICTPFELNM